MKTKFLLLTLCTITVFLVALRPRPMTCSGTCLYDVQSSNGVDTSIISSAPTRNYGTAYFLAAGDANGNDIIYKSLIWWDFTGFPSTTTVYTCTMNLWVRWAPTGNIYAEVWQVLKPWTESGATWNDYTSGAAWSIPGASDGTNDYYDVASIGDVSIPSTAAVGDKITFNLAPDVCQDYARGNITNYGWLITTGFSSNDLIRFNSSDAPPSTELPELVIEWSQ